MLRKLMKLITNNFGLKILALVFALILWLVVVNIEDPDKTKSYTIPVQIENENYISDLGKTYEVLDNTDSITFTVTARRSVIDKLSSADFTATANLQDIDVDMSKVPISIVSSKYANEIEITKKQQYLKVNVENLKEKTYSLGVTEDGEPAKYCYVSSAEVVPDTVTVSGPQSVIKKISKAAVTIDVNGAKKDFSSTEKIVLLDKKGNEVDLDRLSLNHETAAVNVSILMKKSVALNFLTTGTPASGYELSDVTGSETAVTLVGSYQNLESLEKLDISSSKLDISNVKKSFSTSLNLNSYLPSGISLAEGEMQSVTVKVTISGQTKKTFAVPVSNISIENLPDGYSLAFDSKTVNVVLQGYSDDLDAVSADDLKGIIDATDIKLGKQTVSVKLEGDHTLASPIKTSVTVSENSSTSEANSNTDTAN